MSEGRVAREVWITGYGLLSPLGESGDDCWAGLTDPSARAAAVDTQSFAPFAVYPVAGVDLTLQIPRPGDVRAMGPTMHYGVYAAGAALEAAGVKGDEALLAETHLVVASDGGERDTEVDARALSLADAGAAADLNRVLADDLRPTLFLAQLPNLFAGNISIVHGVSGSSRTFMGEEAAGVNAVRVAFERIAAGQGDVFLVGGAFNAERPDTLFAFHAGGVLLAGPPGPLWARPEAGMCLGSAGAFVVLESRPHAESRGVRPLARLVGVWNARGPRTPGTAAANGRRQWRALAPRLRDGGVAVLSGASGAGPVTAEERAFLEELSDAGPAIRGTAGAVGHAMEASFPVNLCLGLLCLERGEVFPPLDPDDPLERRVAAGPVSQVAVTAWGHVRGEGLALMERVDD